MAGVPDRRNVLVSAPATLLESNAMRITFRQLQHASSLARSGSFREAAAELHLSQPALSRSIQTLESSLGITLFDRLQTGVEVTRAGAPLLQQARLILDSVSELEREAALVAGLASGSIRVAMGAYPGHELVPRAIAACLGQSSGFSCQVLSGDWRDAVQSVLSRDADVAVADMSIFEGDTRLELIELEPEPLYFVCRPGHPLAGRRGVELAEVCGFPLGGCLVPPRMAPLFAGFPRAGSVHPDTGNFHPSVEVKSVEAAIRIATLSDVIAAAQLCSVEQQLESGSLVVLDVVANPVQLQVGLIHLRDRTLAPMAQLFLRKIVSVRKELAAIDARLSAKLGIRSAPGRGV